MVGKKKKKHLVYDPVESFVLNNDSLLPKINSWHSWIPSLFKAGQIKCTLPTREFDSPVTDKFPRKHGFSHDFSFGAKPSVSTCNQLISFKRQFDPASPQCSPAQREMTNPKHSGVRQVETTMLKRKRFSVSPKVPPMF